MYKVHKSVANSDWNTYFFGDSSLTTSLVSSLLLFRRKKPLGGFGDSSWVCRSRELYLMLRLLRILSFQTSHWLSDDSET
jgi:hypothetical protein